jgi:hypothetical protein
MKRRRDPLDTVIESALQPGQFIDWKQGHSFIHGLSKVEHEIEALVASNPEPTAYLYETFVAACNMKADEIDDSDGKFGLLVGNVLCGWPGCCRRCRCDRANPAVLDGNGRLLLL